MADDQGVSVCRWERMKQALNGVCGDGRRGGGRFKQDSARSQSSLLG